MQINMAELALSSADGKIYLFKKPTSDFAILLKAARVSQEWLITAPDRVPGHGSGQGQRSAAELLRLVIDSTA